MTTPEYGIHILDAWDIEQQQWMKIQRLSRLALSNALPHRTQAEIDHYTLWQDPNYYHKMRDPNILVGQKLRAKQRFYKPRLVVAVDRNADPIGYMYAADNTSGNRLQQHIKHLTVKKNYLVVRAAAVTPEQQGKGIFRRMAAKLLIDHDVNPNQPIATYIWPDEMPAMQPMLEKHGFVDTGSTPMKPFGTEDVREARMKAPSVQYVLDTIKL